MKINKIEKKMKNISLFEKFVHIGCPLLPNTCLKKGCLKYFICVVTALKSLKVICIIE